MEENLWFFWYQHPGFLTTRVLGSHWWLLNTPKLCKGVRKNMQRFIVSDDLGTGTGTYQLYSEHDFCFSDSLWFFIQSLMRFFKKKTGGALTLNSSYCMITEQEGWTTRGHLVHFSAIYYSRVNCISLKLFLKDWSKKPEHIASVGFSHKATEIITALWYLHDADGWNVNTVVKLWTFIIWSKTVGHLATHS